MPAPHETLAKLIERIIASIAEGDWELTVNLAPLIHSETGMAMFQKMIDFRKKEGHLPEIPVEIQDNGDIYTTFDGAVYAITYEIAQEMYNDIRERRRHEAIIYYCISWSKKKNDPPIEELATKIGKSVEWLEEAHRIFKRKWPDL